MGLSWRAMPLSAVGPLRTVVADTSSPRGFDVTLTGMGTLSEGFDLKEVSSLSRPYGPNHSPKVAEIRIYGKTRPSRNNGWDPTRRNYLTRAFQLRVGRTGAALEGKVPDQKASLLLRR